jgi:hypothetical protein
LRSSSSSTKLWLVIAVLGVVRSRQNGSVSGRTSGSRGLEIGAAKQLLGGGKRPQGGLRLLDRHRQNRAPLWGAGSSFGGIPPSDGSDSCHRGQIVRLGQPESHTTLAR